MYLISEDNNTFSVLTSEVINACHNAGVWGYRFKGSLEELREQYPLCKNVLPSTYLKHALNNAKFWNHKDFEVIIKYILSSMVY